MYVEKCSKSYNVFCDIIAAFCYNYDCGYNIYYSINYAVVIVSALLIGCIPS